MPGKKFQYFLTDGGGPNLSLSDTISFGADLFLDKSSGLAVNPCFDIAKDSLVSILHFKYYLCFKWMYPRSPTSSNPSVPRTHQIKAVTNLVPPQKSSTSFKRGRFFFNKCRLNLACISLKAEK